MKDELDDAKAGRRTGEEAPSAAARPEHVSTAQDDFLATLSHELRTPLSSMLLNAQRLRAGLTEEPAEVRRAGEALERAVWLQLKLIDELLDVSQLVTGKLELDSRPVDLCGAVQASLANVAQLVQEKALVLQVQLDPTIDLIWADRVRVQQVVTSLLGNAIKFTPSGGQLTVMLDAAAGFARVRVVDGGIGIEAELVPQLFARFSQRDVTITRKHGGLGLGLALVRQLVELQGGTVEAHSAGVGLGATFSVTFPLVPASHTAQSAPSAARSSHQPLDRPGKTKRYQGLQGLRVLFVDDDLSIREAVLEVLELTGAHVELASSAAEGLIAIEDRKPEVILCDIAMPVEDGYTFIRKLRAREAANGERAIPALALTALATDHDRRRALAAGFQLHLAKPVDIDRLREAVLELARLGTSYSAPREPLPRAT